MSDHAAGDTVPEVDESRRKFLIAATAGTGAVGAVLTAVPFLASWKPSESARAAGLPTTVDLSRIEPGQMATFFWRKKQIYVVKRTPEMLASLSSHDGELKDAKSEESTQPEYAKNTARALKPEVLVLIGTCTHLGCLPKTRFTPGDTTISPDWPGGFFCPCHGSKFDLAGRVFQGSPASVNLVVPPYSFEEGDKLVIGVDAENKGVA
ncbi:MAG TPA: ubiquinol-cytochrome c reductase iron-sulfur subunit [Steroidobacteraceae bacterium]